MSIFCENSQDKPAIIELITKKIRTGATSIYLALKKNLITGYAKRGTRIMAPRLIKAIITNTVFNLFKLFNKHE